MFEVGGHRIYTGYSGEGMVTYPGLRLYVGVLIELRLEGGGWRVEVLGFPRLSCKKL